MKRCRECGAEKSLHEFAFSQRESQQRQGACRPCSNQIGRENYQQNKARYKAQAAARMATMRVALRKLKDVPCTDCRGRFDWVCMDFDHLPEHSKQYDISYMMRHRMAWDKILAEVAKCEVVCSNCHRLRTKKRGELAEGDF